MSDVGVALGVRPEGKHAVAQEPRHRSPVDRIESLPPAVAGLVAGAIGYAVLVAVTIAVGALLVEVVLTGWVQRADNDVIHWLAARRTSFETDLSWVGSHLAETATVIVVVAVVAILLLVRRRFLAALFLVVAITVEAATYMATVLVIDRSRPRVPRLEDLGAGASYPSGHTAAAVVVYVGIALIVCAYVQNRVARGTAITLAVVAPAAVAAARMYRGMHHPLDVTLGALMGGACLFIGLTVARVVGESCARRHTEVAR
jgi:undecaprenyl-diphosphatase